MYWQKIPLQCVFFFFKSKGEYNQGLRVIGTSASHYSALAYCCYSSLRGCTWKRTNIHHKTQVTKTILIIAVRTQMCFQRCYSIFLGEKDLIMKQQLLSFKNSPQIQQNRSLLLTKKQTSQQPVLNFSRCPVHMRRKSFVSQQQKWRHKNTAFNLEHDKGFN